MDGKYEQRKILVTLFLVSLIWENVMVLKVFLGIFLKTGERYSVQPLLKECEQQRQFVKIVTLKSDL